MMSLEQHALDCEILLGNIDDINGLSKAELSAVEAMLAVNRALKLDSDFKKLSLSPKFSFKSLDEGLDYYHTILQSVLTNQPKYHSNLRYS
jgi:hypothetical protein